MPHLCHHKTLMLLYKGQNVKNCNMSDILKASGNSHYLHNHGLKISQIKTWYTITSLIHNFLTTRGDISFSSFKVCLRLDVIGWENCLLFIHHSSYLKSMTGKTIIWTMRGLKHFVGKLSNLNDLVDAVYNWQS